MCRLFKITFLREGKNTPPICKCLFILRLFYSIFRSKVESTVRSVVADQVPAPLQIPYSTAVTGLTPSRSVDNDSLALSSSVPRLLANNYLLRLSNATRMAAVQRNHCSAAVPRAHLVSSNSSSDIFRCSSSMNTVLWMPTSSYSAAASDAAVNIRIFQIDRIRPTSADGIAAADATTADAPSPSLPDSAQEETCRDLQRFCPHGSSSASNHCTTARVPAGAESAELFFTESSLRAGDYLFIPHGFAVSLQVSASASASAGWSAENSLVLSSCLVDASNLVGFEDSLRASPASFDAALLREMRGGAVDFTLDRHPAELSLGDYLQLLTGLRTISASADGETDY